MTLTQQFLLVSLLPASFLLLAICVLRATIVQRQVVKYWLLFLLTAAVWSSSLLSHYGGMTIPLAVAFTWRVIGYYALTLASLWLFYATNVYLTTTGRWRKALMTVSVSLWLVALGLDPAIWRYHIPDQLIAGRVYHHFDIWGIFWVASWLFPAFVAWLQTQIAARQVPHSFYRSQLYYWLLGLTLFLLATGPALTRELMWQQLGATMTLFASTLVTVSIARRQLPDLGWMLRYLMSRVLGALIVFALTWLVLWFMIQSVVDAITPFVHLRLILMAGLLAAVFMFVQQLVNRVTNRIFLAAPPERTQVLPGDVNLNSNLLDAVQFGRLMLQLIRLHLEIDDAWVSTCEEGPRGSLILRPLASLTAAEPEVVALEPNSPFARYLRENQTPLVYSDLNRHNLFADLDDTERSTLDQWQRVLFVPLHVRSRLVGILALGKPTTEEPFEQQHFLWLQNLSAQMTPLLVQAQNLASLRRLCDHAFQQSKTLARDNRHLQELVSLYSRVIGLISPELRRPFRSIDRDLAQIQDALAESDKHVAVENLSQRIDEVQEVISSLIHVAARMQSYSHADFQLVYLDEIMRESKQKLASMAQGRRVQVDLEIPSGLPPVYGDAQRLVEAVQHLLHNAIKFNKIGGRVRVQCGVNGNELYICVVDNGVGIPSERLPNIWRGFSKLDSLNLHGNSRGTGLGLPLTRFIVRAHGGRVGAISKHGAGSTFAIYLPLALEDE